MNIAKARFRDTVEFTNEIQSSEWNPLVLPGTTMTQDGNMLAIRDKAGAIFKLVPLHNVVSLDPVPELAAPECPEPAPVAKPKKTKKQPAKRAAGKAKPR